MSKHKNNDIIPISDLFGDNFIIPTYQRGYRWTRAQIEDLLNDLKEFVNSKTADRDYYCLQPLVVRDENGSYRTIDGQQRLTTIWMLLLCMHDGETNRNNTFNLGYERDDKLINISEIRFNKYKPFDGKPLIKSNISNTENLKWNEYVESQWVTYKVENPAPNVESFHLFACWLFIHNWMRANKGAINSDVFNDVCVIWHEVFGYNEEIKAFQNLNSGKIPLTNAELIKALFLSSYGNKEGCGLRQELIAEEFDMVERQLRRDDFWYFLNARGEKPTSCISFIFNLMQELDDYKSYEGQDLRNYFYFRDKIQSLKLASETWEQVMDIFHVLEGWYNNSEIYNLIGFLRAKGRSIKVIFEAYRKCKTIIEFRNYLLHRCLETIGWYDDKLSEEREKDLKSYLINHFRFDNDKERVWNLLLLINVLSLNLESTEGKDHKRAISKFSFSDFHNCEWNIEHISPQNPVRGADMIFPSVEESCLPAIGQKLREINDERIKQEIDPYVAVSTDSIMEISNLTFLTDHINKSIGNKNYDEKRDCVIAKQSQGFYMPPSSLMIFTKGYTTREIHLKEIEEKKNNYWSNYDRDAYLQKIGQLLESEYINQAQELTENNSISPKNSVSPAFSNPFTYGTSNHNDSQRESLERLNYTMLISRVNYIVIPKIQRDYAQGRKKSEDPRAALVRGKILNDIFNSNENGIDFQIVFGSEEIRKEISKDRTNAHVFIPIDGQQRLTTLFLLTLYRDKLENKKELEVKFIYETRRAATDFCVDIVNNDWPDFPNVPPKKAITESTWFQQYWLQDPTVDAMLRMLDDIHKKYSDFGDIPNIDKIYFSYFNLGLALRSDEIYLKMNTRGKELTQFENLKATIEKEFGELVPKSWKKKIDSIWQDSFWQENNPTQVPDSRILRFIANLLFVKLADHQDFGKCNALDEQSIANYENIPELYNRLLCMIQLFNIAEKAKKGEYVSTDPFVNAFKIIGITETFIYLTYFFDTVYKGFDLLPYWTYSGSHILDQNYSQRAALYGAALYIQNEYSVTGNNNGAREWMRFVWNIAENDVDDFSGFYRVCRLFDEMQELGALKDVLTLLSSVDSEKLSGTDQFKEERAKASIKDNSQLLRIVKQAESHAFFHGCIRFLFDTLQKDIWTDFEIKVKNLNDLIPEKESDRKTVESLMEYLSDDELKDVFHKYYVNNTNNNLRGILQYSPIREALNDFFKRSRNDEGLTLLQKQLIALAPRHRNFYINNNWTGAHGTYPCVLTKTSTQSWYFATQCFPLDDYIYVAIQQILKEEPFHAEIGNDFKDDKYLIGVEINFRYMNLRFRYYNVNHTIRLIGSGGHKLDNDQENLTFITVSEKENRESLVEKLDKIVDYSKSKRYKIINKIIRFMGTLDENPMVTGFDSTSGSDIEIKATECHLYNWVNIEVIRKEFAIAFTIDRDHRVEVGLRLLPGEKQKEKKTIVKPYSAKQYNNKNRYWHYVYSDQQFNKEDITNELKILIEQYK